MGLQWADRCITASAHMLVDAMILLKIIMGIFVSVIRKINYRYLEINHLYETLKTHLQTS